MCYVDSISIQDVIDKQSPPPHTPRPHAVLSLTATLAKRGEICDSILDVLYLHTVVLWYSSSLYLSALIGRIADVNGFVDPGQDRLESRPVSSIRGN